jgi:hypothetical protein
LSFEWFRNFEANYFGLMRDAFVFLGTSLDLGASSIHPAVFGFVFFFGIWRPSGRTRSFDGASSAPSPLLSFSFRNSSLTAAPHLGWPLGIWGVASWGFSLASRSLIRMGALSSYLAERLQQRV